MRSKRKIFTAILSSLSLYSFSAFAFAVTCQLGTSCPIPSIGGENTHIALTNSMGLNYVCYVRSNYGKFKFFVSGDKDFTIDYGYGYYVANPMTTVEINGHFRYPSDPADYGTIRFTSFTLSGQASVVCFAK